MKTQQADQMKTVRWLSTLLLFGAILAMVFPVGVKADGTDPGELVVNSATINYSVNGVSQDPLDSNAVQFVVDRKVDLIIAPGTGSFDPVTPNSSVVWAIQLENQGNDIQGYRFNIEALVGNTFHADNVHIYLDNGTLGTLDAADDLYSTYNWSAGAYSESFDSVQNAGDLIKDGSMNLLIVAEIPATAADGQTAGYYITATSVQQGSSGTIADDTTQDAGAWTEMTVQTVFADGHGPHDAGEPDSASDGKYSVQVTYTVGSADLVVAKTQLVTSDGIPGSSAPFKAIPGATVQYEISISNNGSQTATGVSVADTIPAYITYVNASVSADIGGVSIPSPAVDYNAGTRILTVTVGDVGAGLTAHVRFNVTID